MTKRLKKPSDMMPLKPNQFLVLLSLASEELHGYALKKEILRRSDGLVNLGPATLHRTIQRLEDEHLIEESDDRPAMHLDDERRKYFRITEFGRRVAALETERLALLIEAARSDGLEAGRFV